MAGEENNNGAQSAGSAGAGGQAASGQGGDSVDAVLGAYVTQAKNLPGVVPELIQGKTLQEVNNSIDAAKAAYQRVAGQASAAGGQAAAGSGGQPVIGTGSSGRAASDQDDGKITITGAFNKILAGIEGKGRQSR